MSAKIGDPRDGGPFTAVTACPKCGTVAVHGLRAVNPEPPTPIVKYARSALDEFAALLLVQRSTEADWFGKNDGFTRWDERPFEVARICVGDECGFEWGQR